MSSASSRSRRRAARGRVLLGEQLEARAMMSVLPSSGDLTEGNASAWQAFAVGAAASVSNDATHVRVGAQALKLTTGGGYDAGIRLAAPAEHWNLTSRNLLDFWTYGDNIHAWQGNQPVIKLVSDTGTRQLVPAQQLMPNHGWNHLSVPLTGDAVWQVTDTGTYDPANVSSLEIHQDTFDFGFTAYYDGLSFPIRGVLDLPVLSDPRGVAVDSNQRALVVETGANRVRILNSVGDGIALVGSAGSGNGQFQTPIGITVDSADRFYVADSGNDRVQIFNAAGAFLGKFGTAGSAPGQFQDPWGIKYDPASDRIYVADSGNHRVQRFFASGVLDTSWGNGGVLGATGIAAHDHTGFDSPRDMAVNPATGQLYVADFNNQRLEVFDTEGNYVRTYLGVYRPIALAFDSAGNLYIAGADPTDSHPAYAGRLRLLKAGDELISQHYTGGIDDLARVERGVAVRRDGKIVLSDSFNNRLVKVAPSFENPIGNVNVQAHGTSITFTWITAEGSSSTVRLGPTTSTIRQEVTDPLVTRTHAVTIDNVAPNTRQYFSLSFRDSFTGKETFTRPDLINTGVPLGQTQFARVRSVAFVYTDGQDGEGYTRRPQAQIDSMKARFARIADFYWRNSGFKLWIDFTVLEVDRDLSDGADMFPYMQPDLEAAGFTATDDIDGVYLASPFAQADLGGGDFAFGRIINAAEWRDQEDGIAIHEVNHSIDNMYHFSDLPKYELNHGIWAVPGGLGGFFGLNGQILRNMLPANLTAIGNQYKKVMTAPDADNDGLPDSSPAGLDTPLSLTEATFGSSTSSPDTDGDGLSDLQEAQALTNGPTDPNDIDSDGDGIRDSVDLNPAYKMNELVCKGTPTIDGTISAGDGWSVLTDHWGYANQSLVGDDNDRAQLSTTYAAWDDSYLYLALQGPAGATDVTVNGNDAVNLGVGPADYRMKFFNAGNYKSVAVNVGVPDLYRQIDNVGDGGDLLDTDPMFTKPYLGRPPSSNPTDGLGFPGRLVVPADLTYQFHASGNNSVWEVRIPWSNVTQLRGYAGRELAINFNSEGDRFFETDATARIRLVDALPVKPLLKLSNSAVKYSENAAAVLLAPTGLVQDNDSFDLDGGVLTVSVTAGGTADDRLSLQSAGTATGQIGVSGDQVLYGGVNVGTLSGGIGTAPLTITLNQHATPAVAQWILRSVAFRAVGDALISSTRTVRFTLSDGAGHTSSPVTMKVNVRGVNDAPVLNSALNPKLGSIAEDATSPPGTLVEDLIAGAVTDPDPNALRGIAVISASNYHGQWEFTLDGGATWQSMATPTNSAARLLPDDARVRFLPKADFNGTVRLYYRAWDRSWGAVGGALNTSGNLGGIKNLSLAAESAALTVKPVNDKPVLAGISGSVGYAPDVAAVAIAPWATVADIDSANFYGGRLRVRITDGASTSNRLVIGAGFTIDASNNVLQGTTIIGRRVANGWGTNELVITFNAHATQAIATQLLRAISFKTVQGTAGARKIAFTLSDGDGGVSDELTKTVNVS